MSNKIKLNIPSIQKKDLYYCINFELCNLKIYFYILNT